MEKLIGALSRIQGEIQNVAKIKAAFKYNYAPLDVVVDMIRPLLVKEECAIVQSHSYSETIHTVQTIFYCGSEQISTTVQAPHDDLIGQNAFQTTGSAITYLRRYALAALFNIASEDDNDASGDRVKKTQPAAKPANNLTALKQSVYNAMLKKLKHGDIVQVDEISPAITGKQLQEVITYLDRIEPRGDLIDQNTGEVKREYDVIADWIGKTLRGKK